MKKRIETLFVDTEEDTVRSVEFELPDGADIFRVEYLGFTSGWMVRYLVDVEE